MLKINVNSIGVAVEISQTNILKPGQIKTKFPSNLEEVTL